MFLFKGKRIKPTDTAAELMMKDAVCMHACMCLDEHCLLVCASLRLVCLHKCVCAYMHGACMFSGRDRDHAHAQGGSGPA